jgi:hypothetical protein
VVHILKDDLDLAQHNAHGHHDLPLVCSVMSHNVHVHRLVMRLDFAYKRLMNFVMAMHNDHHVHAVNEQRVENVDENEHVGASILVELGAHDAGNVRVSRDVCVVDAV